MRKTRHAPRSRVKDSAPAGLATMIAENTSIPLVASDPTVTHIRSLQAPTSRASLARRLRYRQVRFATVRLAGLCLLSIAAGYLGATFRAPAAIPQPAGPPVAGAS